VPRFALLIAYDGADFLGWWRQPGARTVAGELDAAFARIGEPAAAPVGASRTDAGVHARGQVAHAALARPWRPLDLQRALASQLPEDLSCLAAAPVGETWHATHAAVEKTYTYRIANAIVADPFLRRTSWRPDFRLDLAALAPLAPQLVGRRDWRAFARRGDEREDTVRAITAASWEERDRVLICTLSGDGFIYRLARSLVGAMVAIANRSCAEADLDAALAGRDSPAADYQAPARGLCLERVRYEPEPAWEPPQ
jgi:tRNA pseudouridine38-40 synthase